MKIGLIDVDSHNYPNLALKRHALRKMQRWVNSKWIFNSVQTFEEYAR